MSRVRQILGAAFGAFILIVLIVALVSIDAQSPRTVQDGVFSDAQAARGQALYGQRCAGCHGPAMSDGQAPPLVGDAFTTKWRMEPLSALFIKIRYTMPPNTPPNITVPPRLTPDQGAELLAHVLKSNGFPAGKTDFATADATKSTIGWPARGGGAAAAASTGYPPTGNLAQLMRGVFFHNSNLIFSVQELDPIDLPPKPSTTRPEGLTIFEWGLELYTGWQSVESAATAIADASPLMLLPGLRCENGRAAPVTEPDWIRFTERMVTVAKRTLRLAQSQDKEGVSEYTLELSNTCNACHLTYRDIGGRGRGRGAPPNPNAGNPAIPNGARCTHR